MTHLNTDILYIKYKLYICILNKIIIYIIIYKYKYIHIYKYIYIYICIEIDR